MRPVGRSLALALAGALVLAATPAGAGVPVHAVVAKKKKPAKKAPEPPAEGEVIPGNAEAITPTGMAAQRERIKAPIQSELAAGKLKKAAKQLEQAGLEYSDPVLYMDAADARLVEAQSKRSIKDARQAIDLANVALDILFFVQDTNDDRNTKSPWQVVHEDDFHALIRRAENQIEKAQGLVDQIQSDVAAEKAEQAPDPATGAGTPAPAPEPEKPKPYKGLLVSGITLTSLGLAGVGTLAAGMAWGFVKQRDIDALVIPGEDQQAHEITQQGDKANLVAYLGAGLAGAGLVAGIPLWVIGAKRKKAHGPDGSARIRITPGFGGAVLSGRF